MHIIITIITTDLALLRREFSKILANVLFFLISLAIFSLALKDDPLQITSFCIFALISSLIFCSIDFLKKDFDDGTIEQMLIYCENLESYVLGKIISNWLVYGLPNVFMATIAIFLNPEIKGTFFNFALLFFLASLSINFIASFCGSLSLLGNAAPVISVIALPLMVPIMLITQIGIDSQYFYTSIKILSGITVLLGTTMILATGKIIKIASE